MEPLGNNATVIQYAGYDKPTGRIIHTHSRFSVAENRYVEIPIAELNARFSKHDFIVGRLSNRDPNNLDFIKIESSGAGHPIGPMMVDSVQRKLIPKSCLTLSTNKSEIAGDGKDSAEILVSVVDSQGKVVDSASGAIKIATTRGRLSTRGGVVNLVNGRATTTLTSANETVNKVRVSVASLDGPYTPAHVDLEFV
jgi:hypothetical protein